MDPLLVRLGNERFEVGYVGNATDNVAIVFLVFRDLRRKIVCARLKHAWHDCLETGLANGWRQAVAVVAPSLAVGVAREEHADLAVRLDGLPESDIGREHVFEAPEEMISPIERLLVAAARHHDG